MTDQDRMLLGEAFLEHHGIKGQKWGVIRDRATGSAGRTPEAKVAKNEATAKKFEQKAKFMDTKINELNSQQFKTPYGRHNRNEQVKLLTEQRDQHIKDAQLKRDGKLTTNQKKLAVGLSVAAGLAAAYYLNANLQSGEFQRLATKGEARLTKNVGEFPFKKNANLAFKTKDPNEVFDRVVKDVNPGFGLPGTKVNCRRCTFSYELRRRGYDVSATRTTSGSGQTALGLVYATDKNATKFNNGKIAFATRYAKETKAVLADEHNTIKTPLLDHMAYFTGGASKAIKFDEKLADKSPDHAVERIFSTLSKEPEGSRGEVGTLWSMGGGHSMAYEIFNGKATIFDTQSGKMINDLESWKKAKIPDVASAGYTRLDNIELNNDFLLRWVKNAK